VPYRGQCLVHRAEIMQLHGDWDAAGSQALEACHRLAETPAAGEAHYRRGELLRLSGAFSEAEAAYREASASGREPQPGLALLRLAQGQVDAAAGAIRRVVDGADDSLVKARVLAPFVEIMLATGDLDAARSGAIELNEIAVQFSTPFLAALSSHVSGAVRLAEGDYQRACQELRRALAAWRELDAPYEVARVRVLIGCACRELGDADTAEMELDVARSVFARLGAVTDLARAEGLSRAGAAHRAGGLSAREAQVLALVAAGKSNRDIGVELFISEHTVRRHLQNIFTKLGVSSRAAATAFAFQHDLV
jgi:ATP/maltotriose-dependent transcriptional regulator MalT